MPIPTLSCEDVYALVVPYMLDALGAEGDAPIDAHLATCEPCATYFNEVHEEYCAEVQAQLTPYLDRELAAPQLREVEQHLNACGRCRDLFQIEGQMLHAVQDRLQHHRPAQTAVQAAVARFISAIGQSPSETGQGAS